MASFSEERFLETAGANLDCLLEILTFNVKHDLLFFRMSSDIIPFGSHPVLKLDWAGYFKEKLKGIGKFIRDNNIRISMHPDQYVVLNSPRPEVVENGIRELLYHAILLDSMKLGLSAKIQLHIGGGYGDKQTSLNRFIKSYKRLDRKIKQRLAIENDDRLYSLADCLGLYGEIGTPIIFDTFHHELLNSGEHLSRALSLASETWADDDGILMVDYSSPHPSGVRGKHAESLAPSHFRRFLKQASGFDFDLMLEIKDKEKSALKALKISAALDRKSKSLSRN